MILLLTLVLSASMLGAACSNPTGTEAAGDGLDGSVAASTTARPSTTTTTVDPDRRAPADIDGHALSIEGPVDGGAAKGSPGPNPVSTLPTGGSVDVGAIYRGVLGRLGPEEVQAEPVVAAPVAADGTMPLTGLTGAVPSRPAAVVKIDNSPAARPQTGLNDADIVVEEEVEGGITRFAAVFHSRSSTVGPVRSGRTTDIGVLGSLGNPLLMYSGANEVTNALLLAQAHVQNRGFATSSGYWRAKGRKLPSNLYTDTETQWASGAGGSPPAQFAYRSTSTASAGEPVTGLTVSYGANRVSWEWNGEDWLRRQGKSAHTDAAGDQVSAANVVVVEVRKVATGMVDSVGSTVPEFVYVGTGPATVFSDGRRITGTWTKPTLTSVATLTTADGQVIALTPGRTWVEIVEVGAGMLAAG